VLLLIIFAIIDFGRLLFAVQSMKSASREGARAAVVASGDGQAVFDAASSSGGAGAALAGGTLGVEYATQAAPTTLIALANGTTVTHVDMCGTTPGSPVSVTASTAFTWFTPASFFARSVNEVESTTTMRCE
jgi:Flp pilus assembly protein TadG